jgi:hypothetical protein
MSLLISVSDSGDPEVIPFTFRKRNLTSQVSWMAIGYVISSFKFDTGANVIESGSCLGAEIPLGTIDEINPAFRGQVRVNDSRFHFAIRHSTGSRFEEDLE